MVLVAVCIATVFMHAVFPANSALPLRRENLAQACVAGIAGAIAGLDDLCSIPFNEDEARSEGLVKGLADLDDDVYETYAHEGGQSCEEEEQEEEEEEEEQVDVEDEDEGYDFEESCFSDDDLESQGGAIIDDELLNDILSKDIERHADRVAILSPNSCNEAANFVCRQVCVNTMDAW